jgi:hypothetical protein
LTDIFFTTTVLTTSGAGERRSRGSVHPRWFLQPPTVCSNRATGPAIRPSSVQWWFHWDVAAATFAKRFILSLLSRRALGARCNDAMFYARTHLYVTTNLNVRQTVLYYTHAHTHTHTHTRTWSIILFWFPHELPFTDDTDTFSGRSIHMAHRYVLANSQLRTYALLCVSIVPHAFNLNNGISRSVKSPENIHTYIRTYDHDTRVRADFETSSLYRRHLHDRTVCFSIQISIRPRT